ncbi:MAG: TetR/AcrR family transcriptional regulator [Actinobacteria bacterium]|nr:TetR/AcrR family transcriptional regulator [Actinomycetota bacterium]
MSSASEAASQRAAGGAATPRSSRAHLRPAFEDPLSALPETAQKLLVAAKSIIANDGFDALTLNSVSAASGENKAMISYYFGNKAGLVAAVLDSVIHDEYIASHDRMKDVDPEWRTQRLVEEMRRMDTAIEEFRVFFELLPHVLRDETLRPRIASLYRWYWSVKLEWLGIGSPSRGLEDPELLGLAQILSAVIDGLAVQAAIDPEIDLENPYRIFHRMLEASLTTRPDGTVAGVGPADGDHSKQ